MTDKYALVADVFPDDGTSGTRRGLNVVPSPSGPSDLITARKGTVIDLRSTLLPTQALLTPGRVSLFLGLSQVLGQGGFLLHLPP